MKLTKNFTLEELCYTRHPFPNKPNDTQVEALRNLAENILQPARDLFGEPIKVNSGYRSPQVNRAVKSTNPNSQHTKGEAADLDCRDNRKLYEIIRDNLDFDQLINERNYSWIHVSFTKRRKNRNQELKS